MYKHITHTMDVAPHTYTVEPVLRGVAIVLGVLALIFLISLLFTRFVYGPHHPRKNRGN